MELCQSFGAVSDPWGLICCALDASQWEKGLLGVRAEGTDSPGTPRVGESNFINELNVVRFLKLQMHIINLNVLRVHSSNLCYHSSLSSKEPLSTQHYVKV